MGCRVYFEARIAAEILDKDVSVKSDRTALAGDPAGTSCEVRSIHCTRGNRVTQKH